MGNFPYRPNVCMLVHNDQGRLWLGERLNSNGIWQFPQGGVEAEYSLEENVLRELEEELGAPNSSFGTPIQLQHTHRYDFRKPRAYGEARFRGQMQTFWVVPFQGSDTDFNLTRHEPEFSTWRWCTVDEVRQLAEPKRLAGYEPALLEFIQMHRKVTG